MLRCVMMIALTVFLIFYLKEKFQALLAAQYEDRIERSRENYASMMNILINSILLIGINSTTGLSPIIKISTK